MRNLEDLEAGNIQYTDEVLALGLGVESLIDTGHQPREHTTIQGLGQSCHRVHYLNTPQYIKHTPCVLLQRASK